MKAWMVGALACSLALGCAQVREISGGDKDESGPVLLNADPPDRTTGFTADRFTIRFDERIQLERVRDGMLVSPPLDAPPTLSIIGGYSLGVRLNAPLHPNTTYTFSIGEVVKDLTEGNFAVGSAYVISTGSTLDSLELSGMVMNAFSAKPEKGVLVMLYDAADTSNFLNSRPAHATRTDASGAFHLRNLRDAAFDLVALRDLNANYRYDLPDEEIAFSGNTVHPHVPGDSSAIASVLRLFKEVSPVQAIREAAVLADGGWRIVLARPAKEFRLRDIQRSGGSLHWTLEWGTLRDTVLCWPSDTTTLRDGRYELMTEEGALDTLRYRPLKPMPFNVNVSVAQVEYAATTRVVLEASRPLVSFDSTRMTLRSDSLLLPFQLTRDPDHDRQLLLVTDLQPGRSAVLTLLPRSVRDRNNAWNDTLRIGLGRAAEQATGTLRVKVHTVAPVQGQLIVELMDQQGRVVRSATMNDSWDPIVWEQLAPGNHDVRIIEDVDRSGRWDAGQWSALRQPERVWWYPETVNVRAAWDLGIDWDLPGR
ncbi:MAG: Ig-like domain-containing protein [Flavobacteriales bacterium]|nr:Ig-like domain-containing protein [Flavobacteriales bacterium]